MKSAKQRCFLRAGREDFSERGLEAASTFHAQSATASPFSWECRGGLKSALLWSRFRRSGKSVVMSFALTFVLCQAVYPQSIIAFCNRTAPTHIGSIDGPLANRGIWAQFFMGLDPQSLVPVETPFREHGFGGIIFNCTGNVVTFDQNSGTLIYVQMFAWDGNLWGTAFDAVPSDQLGMTDIGTAILSSPTQPASWPLFTQSAIVPIPEPSLWTWGALGLGGIWFAGRRKGRSKKVDK